MGNESKLTDKQDQFCREYLVDLNITQAAIRASYSPDTAGSIGHELLKKPEIQVRIQELMDRRSAKVDVTAEYVLRTIHETVERCRQSFPVLDRKGNQIFVETPEGKQAAAYTFDSKGVLKGCELLGKHLKMFTDKIELTGNEGGPIDLTIATPEEAARAYADKLKKA